MICPHCLDQHNERKPVWPYDDDYVTCKRGHRQRATNALPSVPPTEVVKRNPVPVIACSALALSLLDLLLHLL